MENPDTIVKNRRQPSQTKPNQETISPGQRFLNEFDHEKGKLRKRDDLNRRLHRCNKLTKKNPLFKGAAREK